MLSIAAGAALAAVVLAGCSEAKDAGKDALDDATSQAGEAGESALDDAASDASEAGESMLDDATDGAGSEGSDGSGADSSDGSGSGSDAAGGNGAAAGGGEVTVEYGDFAGDASATAAGDYFTARQGAIVSGDTSGLADVATAEHVAKAEGYVSSHAEETGAFLVTVVDVKGDTVQVCAGPEGQRARTLTVKDGLVAKNVPGDLSC